MDNVDNAWLRFQENPKLFIYNPNKKVSKKTKIPKCGPLKISTKTMIAFLNITIDLNDIFWKLNVIDYYDKSVGILKKQIKINCKNKEEAIQLEQNIKHRNDDHTQVTVLKKNDGKIGCFRDNSVRDIVI